MSQQKPMNQDFLTAKELAEMMKVRPNTIYIWVTRREIPFIKLPGGLTRFSRQQIAEWLKKRTAKGKGLGKGTYLEAA